MLNRLTAKQRAHLAKVKELPCSVCDASPPSEAHHVKQGSQYTCIALCPDCHRGPILGLHGQRRAWKLAGVGEMNALADTIEQLSKGTSR